MLLDNRVHSNCSEFEDPVEDNRPKLERKVDDVLHQKLMEEKRNE